MLDDCSIFSVGGWITMYVMLAVYALSASWYFCSMLHKTCWWRTEHLLANNLTQLITCAFIHILFNFCKQPFESLTRRERNTDEWERAFLACGQIHTDGPTIVESNSRYNDVVLFEKQFIWLNWIVLVNNSMKFIVEFADQAN